MEFTQMFGMEVTHLSATVSEVWVDMSQPGTQVTALELAGYIVKGRDGKFMPLDANGSCVLLYERNRHANYFLTIHRVIESHRVTPVL